MIPVGSAHALRKQAPVFQSVYKAFEEGSLSDLVYNASALPPSPGSPLRTDASNAQRDLVVLYSAIVQGLKSETALPFDSATAFLTTKLEWAVDVAHDEFQLSSMLDLITAFVNKYSTSLNEALSTLLEGIWTEKVLAPSAKLDVRLRALRAYFHVSELAWPS